jgi:predicted Fe-Mo cluster-binding NifX family protein
MQEIRLAVPTQGDKGLEETVSEIFGRAKNFTIVKISDGAVVDIQVIENPALSYIQGAGPVVVKTLADMEVNMVAAQELGPGASTLLQQHNIIKVTVEPGVIVDSVVKDILKKTAKPSR